MAERRMFSKEIIDSDAFLDMPVSSQNLYFHLGMRADDDGFINSPNKIMSICKSSRNDMDLLILKHFIIPFESGIVVIKHWRLNNYLRSDRYKPTRYQDEYAKLEVKTNDVYGLKSSGIPLVYQVDTSGTPLVDAGKISIGKYSLDKVSVSGQAAHTKTQNFVKPTLEEVKAYCAERKNKVNAERFIDFYTSKGWKVGREPMKDWKACVRTWERDSNESNGYYNKPKNAQLSLANARDYSKEDLNAFFGDIEQIENLEV